MIAIDKSRAEVSITKIVGTPHTMHETTTIQNGSIV